MSFVFTSSLKRGVFFLLFVLFLSVLSFSKRLYQTQFKSNSEHLTLPNLICFSIYLGRIKYPHMRLTVESMSFNPKVKFVLINVVQNPINDEFKEVVMLKSKVDNFFVKTMSFDQFSTRVKEKLGISVTFNASWFYKMTDYSKFYMLKK